MNHLAQRISLAIFSFILAALNGCTTYYQVIETKSNGTTMEGGFHVFENDTIKITYEFWAENGVMSFAVFNKIDKPIYIDWKKSAYIDNSNKLNYWNDATVSQTSSLYRSYFYNGPMLRPGLTTSGTVGQAASAEVKDERITFIPPKSNYYRSQFHLITKRFDLDSRAKVSNPNRNGYQSLTSKILSQEFMVESTPLVFRNFLTYSFHEDFRTETYIDNVFFVSKVVEMPSYHFGGYLRKADGTYDRTNGSAVKELFFKNPSFFYLPVRGYSY